MKKIKSRELNYTLAEAGYENKKTRTLFLGKRVNVSAFLYLSEKEVAVRGCKATMKGDDF